MVRREEQNVAAGPPDLEGVVELLAHLEWDPGGKGRRMVNATEPPGEIFRFWRWLWQQQLDLVPTLHTEEMLEQVPGVLVDAPGAVEWTLECCAVEPDPHERLPSAPPTAAR